MSTVTAILRSYRAPRSVLRDHLDRGAGEERALAWLMIACLLFFVARLPGLAREVHLSGGDPPFEALAGGAFVGSVLVAPLALYGLAALSHIVARILGGQGRYLDARLALFWALLASVPMVLLQGLVVGFMGPGPALNLISLLAFGVFLFIWINGLIAVEKA
ncbi:MAG: YIP1 family protein [Litoreibacter sp.]|nr:YIP1 family protein [Litoreibacter sp.]